MVNLPTMFCKWIHVKILKVWFVRKVVLCLRIVRKHSSTLRTEKTLRIFTWIHFLYLTPLTIPFYTTVVSLLTKKSPIFAKSYQSKSGVLLKYAPNTKNIYLENDGFTCDLCYFFISRNQTNNEAMGPWMIISTILPKWKICGF